MAAVETRCLVVLHGHELATSHDGCSINQTCARMGQQPDVLRLVLAVVAV